MARLNLVRIVNTDTRTFTSLYAGDRYTVAPGGEEIVPFEAACLWFGNPKLKDINAKERHRTVEFKRLRVKYGAYDNEELFEAIRPKVEVYTLEGERVSTVAEDPYGLSVEVKFEHDHIDPHDLASEVLALRGQLSALVGALDGQLNTDQKKALAEAITSSPLTSATVVPDADAEGDLPEADPVELDELPEDKPTKPRTSRARATANA